MNAEEIRAVQGWLQSGKLWLSPAEAAEVLKCNPTSLMNAANKKGTLGSIQFYWAGANLKISTMGVMRFLTGGYPLQEIFGTGRIGQ